MIKMTQKEFDIALAKGRTDFTNLDLKGLDVSGRTLGSLDFSGSNLEGANFSQIKRRSK
jgi:uncharacterized protein YjbI with pentapeptide repeats